MYALSDDEAGSNVDAVILCGGRGRRLGALTKYRPKPLIPIIGKPLIIWVIEQLMSLHIRRLIFVVNYLQSSIEKTVQDYIFNIINPPEIIWVQQAYKESEGAVLSGVLAATSSQIIVRCSDDLLSDKIVKGLLSANGVGGIMTRFVTSSPLLRPICQNERIIGGSLDDILPIMTYNLCLDSNVLRQWCQDAVKFAQPMVNLIYQYLEREIYVIDGADSIGINTVADIQLAKKWLQET